MLDPKIIEELTEAESKLGTADWKADVRPALNSNYVCANGPWRLAHIKDSNARCQQDGEFMELCHKHIKSLLAHIAAQDRALKQCGEVITDLVAIVEQLRFHPTGKLQVRSLDYPAVTDAKIVLALPEVQKAMKGK